MSKQIPLTQGLFATVDNDDFEFLSQWKWHAINNKNTFYVVRTAGWPIQKRVWMHRFIMNTPKSMDVDHIDGNGLNNTRANLRNCTHLSNCQNNRKSIRNTSGYKGVNQSYGKWQARIQVNGKSIHLGYFSNIEDAVHAYDEAAKKYHGEFARVNNTGGSTDQ